jgi:ferredoxin
MYGMSNYVGVIKNEGQWFAIDENGENVKLNYVANGRIAPHFTDPEGNIVAKKCTVCGDVLHATTEYFWADKRRPAGLQSKCITCHRKALAHNKAGLSAWGEGKKRPQSTTAKRVLDENGVTVAKECPKCQVTFGRDGFPIDNTAPDGLKAHCNHCTEVVRHNSRARRLGLRADLTVEEWRETLDKFGGRCALTGDSDISFDHALALSKGGGTTKGNVFPLSRRLNMSKGSKSLFEWFLQPDINVQIDDERFEILVKHFAAAYGLTPEEYESFYQESYDNGKEAKRDFIYFLALKTSSILKYKKAN